MWSDKETTEDLLGYTVHASLLKSVVTNDKNLPITVGLYGDWGSGKTSILKILEEELKNDNDTVVVYFDGWSFESFDDAKMALIQGIVDALEKDKRFFAKVGDKATETYEALKKADYFKHVTVHQPKYGDCDGWIDRQRMLLFLKPISCKFAEAIGITWKEDDYGS